MLRRPPFRPTGPPPAAWARGRATPPWSQAALLSALAVTLVTLAYYAQFSGSARWFLGVTSLSLFALFAWALILRRTADPPPLLGRPAVTAVQEGELETLAAAVRRAARGLGYSQLLVASRAHAAFVERVRLSLGLSPERMRDLQRDAATLRRVLRDDVLLDFVRVAPGELDDRGAWVNRARARGGFTAELRDVLARMEAWR